ncbi:hypothetical protein F5Y04DRAFT_275690 [Hypomontagnella monticulosa]|nr:hypothetical protein F5Y04DRAFT_275690 [Hypomontagnella monticulosa]
MRSSMFLVALLEFATIGSTVAFESNGKSYIDKRELTTREKQYVICMETCRVGNAEFVREAVRAPRTPEQREFYKICVQICQGYKGEHGEPDGAYYAEARSLARRMGGAYDRFPRQQDIDEALEGN